MYFFSSMSVYKTLYKRVNEEKNLLNEDSEKLHVLIKKYEGQVKSDASVMKGNHDNLQTARDEVQQLRLENSELKHQVDILQKRSEELYAQVNTMV